MSSSSTTTWRLLIPREHGSWGMWLLPLLSAAVVGCSRMGGSPIAFVWFLVSAAAAFMIYQPLEELLGFSLFKIRSAEEKRAAWLWVTGFSCVALAALAVLVFDLHREKIAWLGALSAICFALRASLGMKRTYRVLKELIGSLALSSTALGAYYTVTGRIDRNAWGLWAASCLFAVAQIEYVQMRIAAGNQAPAAPERPKSPSSEKAGDKERSLQARSFRVLAFHFILPAAALAAWVQGLVPALTLLAFLPALLKVVVWRVGPRRKLRVHRLGVSELVHSIVFSAALAGAYMLGEMNIR